MDQEPCIYELSMNEEMRKRTRESVMNVLENFDNKFSYDIASYKMDFLEQCINGLQEFLQNPLIQGRRLYAVGNYGETEVLNGVILNELYENYKSVNSPDCLLHKSKFTSLLDTQCSSSSTIQLWNDIFLYESQNRNKIAIIFFNIKSQPGQSQYESRIFSALSWLMSSIYFVLSEESFYNEYYGKEAQECDFNFHINELDQRNEIDESILEIHSILSHQNLEMHEDLHFAKENLKIENFLDMLNLGVDKIHEIENERNQKLEKFVENLKQFIENSKIFDEADQNLDEKIKLFKEEAVTIYMNLTSSQIAVDETTTPKLQRKLKIFLKKLRQIERIATTKVQTFITEIAEKIKKIHSNQLKVSNGPKILNTKDSQLITFGHVKFGENAESAEGPENVPIESDEDSKIGKLETENFSQSISKLIDTAAEKLFDNFTPDDEKIRTGSSRNYIKTLQKLFETSNSEIRKSDAFKKLMKQRKISIPLPCDVKC